MLLPAMAGSQNKSVRIFFRAGFSVPFRRGAAGAASSAEHSYRSVYRGAGLPEGGCGVLHWSLCRSRVNLCMGRGICTW